MNRETKLGLIIGTSFVSLVAVVLFNTWNRTEETGPEEPPSNTAKSAGPEKSTAPTNNQITTVGAKQEVTQASAPGAAEPGKLPPTSSGWTAPGTPALPPGPPLVPSSTPVMPPPGYGQTAVPPPPPGVDLAHQGASLNGTERLIVMPEVENPAIAAAELPTIHPVPVSPGTPPAGPPAWESNLLKPPPPGVLPGQTETSTNKLPAAGLSAGGKLEPVPPPPPGVGHSLDPTHIGSEATPSVGNITVPSPPVGVPPPALVESHPEKLLVAGADEDFAKLSTRAFDTADYGQALYAFNRDHPADPLAGLPPGTLKSGTIVYVPPADVLKQKYGSLIKATPAAPVNPMPQYTSITPLKPTPQDQISPPPPPTPQGGWTNATPPQSNPNKEAPATSNSGPTSTTKPYWVPADGKYYYEIARETLGDGTRWGDIWRLNTNYPPENRIPGGTQLRLPPDAH
jgi:hypothetical protein